MEKITTKKQRNLIQEIIQLELLKRGITTQITSFKEKGGRLVFETENFQTTPVIFKTLKVANFSSGFSKHKIEEVEHTTFYIGVTVNFNLFTGGSNSCNLFSINGMLSKDGEDVYKIEIS